MSVQQAISSSDVINDNWLKVTQYSATASTSDSITRTYMALMVDTI